MPIYEFYCGDCHTIYSFFTRTVNTNKKPGCPKCGLPELERKLSGFATLRKSKGHGDTADDDLPIDESKMETAMNLLASEAEGMNENDPKAAAKMMRKFGDLTGMQYGEQMEKALSRLESGEDPESVEQEMGDLLENDDMPFEFKGKKLSFKQREPKRDETVYDL